jgi:hypothetical protein
MVNGRKVGGGKFETDLRRRYQMKISNSVIAGVALIAGFALGSVLHPLKAQARGHVTAHIEQVFSVPTGHETNGSIAGFSCANGDGKEPQCFALIVSSN